MRRSGLTLRSFRSQLYRGGKSGEMAGEFSTNSFYLLNAVSNYGGKSYRKIEKKRLYGINIVDTPNRWYEYCKYYTLVLPSWPRHARHFGPHSHILGKQPRVFITRVGCIHETFESARKNWNAIVFCVCHVFEICHQAGRVTARDKNSFHLTSLSQPTVKGCYREACVTLLPDVWNANTIG